MVMEQPEDESSRLARSKRQAAESNQEKEKEEEDNKYYVFGTQCAAFFESVTMLDQTVGGEAKPVALAVDNQTISFDCSKGYDEPQV